MKLKDLIVEKKNDKIQVQGLGTYDYKSLKRNVEKKIKDLTKKIKKVTIWESEKINLMYYQLCGWHCLNTRRITND